MATVIVLFNLKPGVDPEEYRAWARAADLPTVRSLSSVDSFRVLAASALLDGSPSPYEYVEIIDVTSVAGLIGDVGTSAMQQISEQFQGFADAPMFIVTESIEMGH